MKGITKFLLISGIIIMLFGASNKSESVSPAFETCAKPGCDRMCDSGQIYCYRHRTYDHSERKKKSTSTTTSNTTYNNTKSNKGSYETNNRNKLPKKSYYTDDMPDCDDYDSWGEFMDDWDGNMPDGSDASDYWDNW